MKILSYNVYGVKETDAPIPKWETRQENIEAILNSIFEDEEIKVACFQEVNENNKAFLSNILEKYHFKIVEMFPMKTSTYNFDMRIDMDYNVYLMEVAPRDGGNYIPDVIKYATGVDLVECSVKAAMGERIDTSFFSEPVGYYSYFAVHSLKDGILDKVEFTE